VTKIQLEKLTVGELLSTYGGILDELRARGLIRTKNAPVGDLAEYACALAYGGELAKNSAKSYDLVAADGRLIQVKVRNVNTDTSPSQTFSPIRSFDFDACVFILINQDAVSAAYEWSPAEVTEHGKHRVHTNGTILRVGQITAGGIDVTQKIQAAWTEMLALGSAVLREDVRPRLE
jgi:hypothetical protein